MTTPKTIGIITKKSTKSNRPKILRLQSIQQKACKQEIAILHCAKLIREFGALCTMEICFPIFPLHLVQGKVLVELRSQIHVVLLVFCSIFAIETQIIHIAEHRNAGEYEYGSLALLVKCKPKILALS